MLSFSFKADFGGLLSPSINCSLIGGADKIDATPGAAGVVVCDADKDICDLGGDDGTASIFVDVLVVSTLVSCFGWASRSLNGAR